MCFSIALNLSASFFHFPSHVTPALLFSPHVYRFSPKSPQLNLNITSFFFLSNRPEGWTSLLINVTSHLAAVVQMYPKDKERRRTHPTQDGGFIILMQRVQPSHSWYDVFWTDMEILSIFIIIFQRFSLVYYD